MADYKGAKIDSVEELAHAITADLRETKTDRYVGKVDSVLSEFNKLKGNIVPEEGLTSALDVVGLSMSKDGNGYATLDVNYSTARGTAGDSSIVVGNKETKARCSISLQQVPLLQHPKFSWLVNGKIEFNVTDSEGTRRVSMPTIKGVQEWISVAQGTSSEGEMYLASLYSALSEKIDSSSDGLSALDYAIRVMNGQTHFYLPQATFTLTKTCDEALPDEAVEDVGKITKTLPAPFTGVGAKWQCLKSGADVDYDKQAKRGTYSITWIGMPTDLGGGWDTELYKK